MHVTSKQRPRKQPRKVYDRGVRERALISAAAKLFASRGYEATTTREIALEAGCAEGLIHRYFHGKPGLLMALIKSRVSRTLAEMSNGLAPSPRLDKEIMQLVRFELKRFWEDQDFFKVFIPCAINHPAIGRVARNIGPQRRAQAVMERLKQFVETRELSRREVESVAHFVGAVTFMFGFFQPVVLGRDRRHAQEQALSITRMFVRGFPSASGK